MRWFWILFITLPCFAEEVNPWLGLSVQKSLSSDYTALWENQYRLRDGQYNELQWRLGLIYKKSDQLSFAAGGFFSFNKDYKQQEFRPWQQIIYNQPLNDFSLILRYRQEQRFFTLTDEFAHRSRFLVRFNYHLNKITPYVSTEFFLGLNEAADANFPRGYNQNRTQIGAVYRFNENFAWENSLMQVYNKGMDRSNINNVFWSSFQFRFK